MPEPSDVREIVEIIHRLNISGWSIGSTAFDGPAGRVWLVSGRNGENLVRAEGATEVQAWRVAIERAREVGMLAREA